MGDRDSKVVLTLFGNTPTPKQLFSSLRSDAASKPATEETSDAFDESSLPYGINTTEIIPIHTESSTVPKLGDLFAAPSTLLPLEPPKPLSQSPRSNVVRWNSSVAEQALRSKQGTRYTSQPLKSGQWLNYTNAAGESRGRKRSLDDTKAEEKAAKVSRRDADDALFNSVYSSFAPTRDDSEAVVPEAVKNVLWWNRIGRARFERRLQDAAFAEPLTNGHTEDLHDEDEFKEAVQEWEPAEEPADFSLDVKREEDKEVDDILKEVNELIENLHSRQRIRNLAKPKKEAKPALPQPDEGEFDTYTMLRDQLKFLIAGLPPFAVAKLNGDQLEALNIQTKIPVETRNYVGAMDEDETVVQAAAMASRLAQNRPSVSTASAQRPLQGRPSFVNPVRPAAPRPPVPGIYPQQRPMTLTGTRPGSFTPGTRPGQPGYTSSNPQQYFQQSSQSNGFQTPTPQQPTHFRQLSASSMQNSVQRPPASYQTNGTPIKPIAIATASSNGSQLSAEQQTAILERQKAQLAIQRAGSIPSDFKRSMVADSPATPVQLR